MRRMSSLMILGTFTIWASLSAAEAAQPHQAASGASAPVALHAEGLGLEPDAWVAIFTMLLCVLTGALALYTAKLYKATVRLGEDAKDASARAVSLSESQ